MKIKLLNHLREYIEWDNNSILTLDYDIDLYIRYITSGLALSKTI